MSTKILIIFFSLCVIFFTGCRTTDVVADAWGKPIKPELVQPNFILEEDRTCLDDANILILRNNILEMKAYEEKLEFLVDEMLEFYTQ
jgi:hypothetical protein